MEPNVILITVAGVVGATGVGLLFVGMLMAMLIALGNKHYVSGVLIFVFFPFAYFYCFKHKENGRYAAKILYPGIILFTVFIALLWWELSRLGLDPVEVLSTTRPKH